jgi:hypothetical protein
VEPPERMVVVQRWEGLEQCSHAVMVAPGLAAHGNGGIFGASNVALYFDDEVIRSRRRRCVRINTCRCEHPCSLVVSILITDIIRRVHPIFRHSHGGSDGVKVLYVSLWFLRLTRTRFGERPSCNKTIPSPTSPTGLKTLTSDVTAPYISYVSFACLLATGLSLLQHEPRLQDTHSRNE